MKKFLFRIVFVLLIVILLPFSFFTIKQITAISENEAMVKEVFDKQIGTILFTLNQTSENIIQNWVARIDLPAKADSGIMEEIISNLLQNTPSIYNIEFIDLENNQPFLVFKRNPETNVPAFLPPKEKVGELTEHLKNGYQRVEAFKQGEYTILYFLLKNHQNNVAAILYVHTKTFIEQNLGASFQAVAQKIFDIQIIDKNVDRILYSTGDAGVTTINDWQRQDAWYLPNIEFRIHLRTATIDSLVKDRSRKDNLILVFLITIVIIGLTFLIMTIRKEIIVAEMKSEFVSNVSHEIRTPLALISMYAETLLLKRVKTPEKETEYLNVIHNESNRLSEMVNRILSFSKMEKMKRQYHFEEVDVNDLIDEVIYSFGPHLKAKNVECLKSFDCDLPFIMADREALHECIVNLVDNAVKYGREDDKKIWIRTRCDHNSILIDVEDNGVGIAKKHLPYIFDKFYRVTKGNLAHQAKGTGIGLNIVQQIVNKHNGKIMVKSKPGEGSCFTLSFPLNSK